MRNGDVEYFKKYYRMTPHQFDFLLSLLREDLERKHVIREPICPAERLAMTLRNPILPLGYMSLRGSGTPGSFQTALELSTANMYISSALGNLEACTLTTSNYKFVVVDVGAYGKQSDGGVLEQSIFGRLLDEGKLQLPRDLPLPNTTLPAPCVFIGDEAFQLRTDFMRPYPGRGLEARKRIFNYRLSRARQVEMLTMLLLRCVENAFGILVTRWRILERAMGECPENAEETVKALCVLHNFLMDARTGSDDFYCGPGYADSVSPQGQRQSGQWRQLVVQPPM
ncbi:hypothetical protein HPB49_011926 [Dermacentor silvarum]|uniref:Uncharacterized protein n=1 Tax=Dermacentor silvarum TaxID=543639 RepID=A0ACB8DP14_DERSI|nr:hypothetical protein HPB49_011926 [Dermacentor silvarum]